MRRVISILLLFVILFVVSVPVLAIDITPKIIVSVWQSFGTFDGGGGFNLVHDMR